MQFISSCSLCICADARSFEATPCIPSVSTGIWSEWEIWIGQEIQSFVLTAINYMLVSDGTAAHRVNVQNESCATAEFLRHSWTWHWDRVGEERDQSFEIPLCLLNAGQAWTSLVLPRGQNTLRDWRMQPLAAHVNWGTSGQWKIHQAEECSSCRAPSLPHPALTPSTPSSVAVAGVQ